MKRYFLPAIAIVFFTATTTSAQTHKIMHRSHGGSDPTSRRDDNSDNFGLNEATVRKWKEEDSTKAAHKREDSIKATKLKGPSIVPGSRPKKK